MDYKKVAYRTVKKQIKNKQLFKGLVISASAGGINWNEAVKCELTDLVQAEQLKNRMRIKSDNTYGNDKLDWYILK